jgi:predicted ArsR family transcriptional regulator
MTPADRDVVLSVESVETNGRRLQMNEFEESEYEKYIREWETQFSPSKSVDKRMKDFQNFEIKVPNASSEIAYYLKEYNDFAEQRKNSKVNDWAKEAPEQTDAEIFIEKAEDLVENIHNALQDLLEFLYDKYDV